jgi:hypothetical protein
MSDVIKTKRETSNYLREKKIAVKSEKFFDNLGDEIDKDARNDRCKLTWKM